MVDAALPREVLPVQWCQSTLFTDGACSVTTDLIMRVDVREKKKKNNNNNNKTVALEARNLKAAYQVYIVDYYYRLTTAVSSITHAHDMLSRRYLLLLQKYYQLLLCHRLVRHAVTRSSNRKKTCPGIQIRKSSPRFSYVFPTSRA